MENTQHIWNGIDFDKVTDEKSPFDFLKEVVDNLEKATAGILKNEIESINGYIGEDLTSVKFGNIYYFYVVAPNLAGFRRKLLTVISEFGTFPVNIYCNVDKESLMGITSSDFLGKIQYFLSKESVKSTVLSLYKESQPIRNVTTHN